MSDYLGNILDRSFAPAPDVRPRLPSLFEPLSASVLIDGPADPVPAVESVEADHAPPSIVAAQPASPPRTERMESPVREANRLQWRRTIQPAAAARPDGADTGPAPARPPVVTPAAAAQSLPRHPLAEPGPAKSAFSPSSSRLGSAGGDDQALPRVVQPIEASSRPRLPAAPKRDIEALESGEMAFRALPDKAEPAGIIVRPSTSAREIAGRPDLAAGPGESAPAPQVKPETLPSIQVTIGRVEVRAALPPAQPRAKPKREPEMSLETYLKRRFEGGRR